MSLVMTSPPAIEPVSLAEAKLHLRVDHATEDALINALIMTARLHIETALGLALITQSWSYVFDAWPESRTLGLPLRPLGAVTALRVYAADGSSTIFPAANYVTDLSATQPRIVLQNSASRPTPGRPANGIEAAMTVGYGPAATDVPQPLRQALLILVAHWYEHRSITEIGTAATRIPDSASALLAPYRSVRL